MNSIQGNTYIVSTVDLRRTLMDVEKEVYKLAMERTQFNQMRAAKLLGVSRGTLRKKLVEHFGNFYIAPTV